MGWDMKAYGLTENLTLLENFNKDVAKVLKREMRSGANEVAKASRSLIPNSGLTNWGAWTYSKDGRDLGFIGSWVKSKVTVETDRTRMSGMTVGFGYRVGNWSAAGAIYELAGSRSKRPMPRAMEKKHPVQKYPRTLFAAYYQAMPKAVARIEAAIAAAEREASS